jgi:hypothetical protein
VVGWGTAGWALALSTLALVLSIVSVVVTIELWRRSGPRIKVDWKYHYPMYGGNMGPAHIGVTATNKGRGAATISSWGLRVRGEDSRLVDIPPTPGLLPLPHRIEPHDSASWMMPCANIARTMAPRGGGWTLHPFVTLSTGKEITARKPVTPDKLR